jgi:tetratricopeptide (TPR) repeat protein
LGRQIECGVCHQRIGDIRLALGDLAGAMRSFKTSLHIDTMVEVTVKLTQVGADRVEVLHNISISMEKVGIALLALGQLNDAMNICEEVLSIRKQLVQQNPKNELLLRNLAVSHEKIGELLTLNGKLPEALTALQTALAIREKLFGWQQVNTEWQRDLTVSQEKVGHILLMLGKLDEALENFRVCLSVRNNLVAIDQDNETWQIDLTNCYDLIGKALEGKSDYPAAMSAYQASFIIRKGLTDSPPQYRPDLHSILAYSYQHIGNLQLLQEDPKAAINALQTCLDIRRNVVNEFPDNPKWQIALSQTHEMIGDVWLAREDVDAALGEYKAALTISDALVLANPENQDWKMNLSICLGKVGDAHLKQGQHEMALAKYQESLKIPQVLADGDKGNFLWQSKLAAMHERIGGALKKQGKFNESLDAYQVSLDIRQDLVKTYDGNETLHWELSISHIKMGDALEAQGNLTAAMEQYLACLSIRKNLADFHPANNAWQEALEEINYFIHEGLQKLWLRNRALNNLSEMFASLNDILVAVKQLATIYKNNTFAQLELIWVNILLAQCYEDQDKYSPNAFNYKHANEHWSHAYEIYIGMINHGLKKSKVDKLAAPLLEFMNIAIDHYLIDTAGEEDNILAWLKTMVSETERQFNQKLVSLFHKEINKEYEIVHLGFVVDKCIKLLKKGRVMEFTSPHLFSAVVNLSDRSGKPMGKIIREVLSRLKSEGLGEQAKEFKNYLEEMSVPGYGKSFWQTLLRVILRR